MWTTERTINLKLLAPSFICFQERNDTDKLARHFPFEAGKKVEITCAIQSCKFEATLSCSSLRILYRIARRSLSFRSRNRPESLSSREGEALLSSKAKPSSGTLHQQQGHKQERPQNYQHGSTARREEGCLVGYKASQTAEEMVQILSW